MSQATRSGSVGEHPRGYRLAAVALAPLLVAQGLRVRQQALRLPEPPGARTGRAGHGPLLRLLIGGDSAAAGVGARHQEEGLSGALVRALREEFTVDWQLRARTGLRTGEFLAWVEAAVPERFDVALLSLGVNDVTGGTRSRQFAEQQRRLVEVLTGRFGTQLVVLTGLPPMHVFPALPQPLRWVLGARARVFTGLLEAVAASGPGCALLTPELPLDLDFIAEDGFHPGPRAYAEWGRQAADLIRARCRVAVS